MTDFCRGQPKLRQPARWASYRGNIWIISTWKQRDIDILPSTARYEQTFPVSLRGQTQLHRICINTGSFSPCARLVAEQSLPNMFIHRYLHTSPSLQPGRARAIARWGCKFLCPADEGLTSNARREACVFWLPSDRLASHRSTSHRSLHTQIHPPSSRHHSYTSASLVAFLCSVYVKLLTCGVFRSVKSMRICYRRFLGSSKMGKMLFWWYHH